MTAERGSTMSEAKFEFKIGDWVRWESPVSMYPNWVEGRVVNRGAGNFNWLALSISASSGYRFGSVREVGTTITLGLDLGATVISLSPERGGEDRCAAEGCFIPTAGGACSRCRFPKAFAHPSCISAALDADAVYINGTALVVVASHDVPVGVVNIVARDGRAQQILLPSFLKVGDPVMWLPPPGCPLGSWAIYGVVDEMLDGVPILRVSRTARRDVYGSIPTQRPQISARLDTSVFPGIMKRWDILKLARPIAVPVRQDFVTDQSNPLNVKYDGVALDELLMIQRNENQALCGLAMGSPFTATQRAAVSAHWSAALRAKVQASEETDRARRPTVMVELQDVD
jgi:hypothetical protein